MVLEGADRDELYDVIDFCIAVGLPVSLADMESDDITDEQLKAVAEKATIPEESIHNMPFPVTADMVANAIKVASEIGAARKAGKINF